MPIQATRALLGAVLSGELADVEFRTDPVFGFEVPVTAPGVDESLLDPRSTWADPRGVRPEGARARADVRRQLRDEARGRAARGRRGRAEALGQGCRHSTRVWSPRSAGADARPWQSRVTRLAMSRPRAALARPEPPLPRLFLAQQHVVAHRDGAAARAAACASSAGARPAARRTRRPRARRTPARARACSRRSGSPRRAPRRPRTSRRAPAEPTSQSCSSRRPGVSITSPPPGRTSSWRCVVVWRPSSSSARVSLRRHGLLAEPAVDERRLADAGRAEQDGRGAGPDAGAQCVAALAGDRGHDVHGHAERDRLDLRDERPRIVEPVGLRQHDLGRGAALPERDEIALDAPRLEIRAERRDRERDVDVRCERLRIRGQACRVPDDGAAARQHRPDQAVRKADPVADADVEAVVHEPAGQARADGAGLRPDVEGAAMNGRDASRHETGLQVFGELVVPAELVQVESGQRKSSFSEMGRRNGIPGRSVPALRSGGPRRWQAQASLFVPPLAGETDEGSVGGPSALVNPRAKRPFRTVPLT